VSRREKFAVVVAVIILALLTGCASRVAPHDAAIAAGLADLQASTGRFFDQLQQVIGTPDADWECHAAWYEQTRAEIDALRVRAAAYGVTNASTLDALALLDDSVGGLEQAHAAGLSSAAEIPVLRSLFDSQLRMLVQLEAAKQRTPVAGVWP
jgi:hypothetical protein